MSFNLEQARQEKLAATINRVAKYEGGQIAYSIIGEPDGHHNRIVTVKGFSRGRMAWLGIANHLSKLQGKREVIISDQPKLKAKMPIVEHQAKALLAILEDSDSAHLPIDFVAHSFGCVILSKAAQLAKHSGMDMTPFDSERGSHSVFLAPAGTYPNENPFKVTYRFARHKKQSIKIGRAESELFRAEIDEDRHKQPLKTLGEARAMGSEIIDYKGLSELGLRPAVLLYPHDLAFPYKLNEATLQSAAASLGGVAMVSGAEHGTHNDPIFDPKPTARAVLQFLDQ